MFSMKHLGAGSAPGIVSLAVGLATMLVLALASKAVVPLLILLSTDVPLHGRYLSHTVVGDYAIRTQWRFSPLGSIHLVQAWKPKNSGGGTPGLMVCFDLVPCRVDVRHGIAEYAVKNYSELRRGGVQVQSQFPHMGDMLLYMVRCPAADLLVYRSVFFDGRKDLGVLKLS